MAELKTVTVDTPIEEIITTIEENGCVVIEGLIDKNQLGKLSSDMQYHLNATENCHGDFYGYKTKRISGLITKSDVIKGMTTNPTVLKTMDAFLLKGCSEYQLNLTQAISIGPKEPSQIIHRDDSMFPFEKNGNEAMINCMWAVDDFTTINGATNLVPGSHKWAPDRHPEPEEITQGVMKAGSVLIYLGSLIHGGGGNTDTHYRTGVVLSYSCGWLRQAENHYLTIPLEELKTYTPRLQKLLGYFVHEPNLGSIDGRDPIELLQNKPRKPFTEYIPKDVQPMIREHRNKQKVA